MKLAQGNMWDQPCGCFLFTGNSYLRNDGALVMGRGAALETLRKFPGCQYVFGQEIDKACGHMGSYGVVLHPNQKHPRLGAFQVKWDFKAEASIELISFSILKLFSLVSRTGELYGMNVSINFPGIGFGRRKREDILPLLQVLPDSITIWELP